MYLVGLHVGWFVGLLFCLPFVGFVGWLVCCFAVFWFVGMVVCLFLFVSCFFFGGVLFVSCLSVCPSVGLVGRLVGRSVGCLLLAGWLACWFLGSLVPWFLGSLVAWWLGGLVAWWLGGLVCWLDGWLVCWLVGWMVGLLVGWLVVGCLVCSCLCLYIERTTQDLLSGRDLDTYPFDRICVFPSNVWSGMQHRCITANT